MHQRRQAESTSGSGDMPQRPLMTPFSSHLGVPYQHHQHLHATNYLQYPMPMEPSLRNYSHQQQPMQQLLLPPQGMYWQAPTGLDTLGYNTKQGRHGNSLDLEELGGMLEADSNSNAGRPPSNGPPEMTMTNFDVNSFHEGMTSSNQNAVVSSEAFPPPVALSTMPSRPPVTPTMSTPPRVTNTKKTKKVNPSSSDIATKAVVDAAFTQLSESPPKSDLRPGKLFKDKSEKCQFHDCPNRARVSQSYGKFCNRHVIVAPCGFPGCRDKAMDRGAMCATHTEQGKEALQKILDARSQNVPVCKISGCFKNDQGRGYCRGHEKLLMATGRLPPHINKRRLNSAYTMCSYPDCSKHSQRHHLCRTHGNLLIKQARDLADRPGATDTFEDILSRMQKEIRRCTHENCSKNSQRDRLCTTHYSEKHNLQKDALAAGTSGLVVKDKKDVKKPRGGGCGDNGRTVERISCGHPGCGKLSYAEGLCAEHMKESQNSISTHARFGPSFSAEKRCGPFSNDTNSVAKAISSENPQVSDLPLSEGISNHTKCTNPMCDRESYGQDYCEACQRLFSSLATPISLTPSVGYMHNATSGSAIHSDSKSLLCRVSDCEQGSVRGGLCSAHLRAFRTGLISVDNLKLESQAQQIQHEQELAEAAAVAAAAADDKQSNSSASSKVKKYYCKVEGCGKQAQKQHMCKRHHRLQEDYPVSKSQLEASMSGPLSNYVHAVPQTVFAQPITTCQFANCSQVACNGTLLCLAHSKATFCWQPDARMKAACTVLSEILVVAQITQWPRDVVTISATNTL
ncbi:atpdependent dna helicase [Plasmopara halstedii]|uniref:Atpdependent dna helicase n=1 Tax=Plasmopara halstedii TaxID=4781 RepID=A0A0P1AX45_PLAHL|nr:atpdependent dna helicase [Plasmopara halstedii]CEG45343.1 atpdependent dna helicase [Plasmopara halstedii]|eukprot:XP_024581712.1 atpdependent dna helicase [Plasmopara halstedii]